MLQHNVYQLQFMKLTRIITRMAHFNKSMMVVAVERVVSKCDVNLCFFLRKMGKGECEHIVYTKC
jgi:hypothetical protein